MSSVSDDDAVPDLVHSSPTPSSSVDPDFTGEWQVVSHDNLESLLVAQGFSSSNLTAALQSSLSIRQNIRHTRHHFRVTVNDHTTVYLITAGQAPLSEDEEDNDNDDTFTTDQLLTASTMEWMRVEEGEEGAGTKRLVVTSTAGDQASERRMVNGRMLIINTVKGVRAQSWLERKNENERRREEERKEKQRAEEDG